MGTSGSRRRHRRRALPPPPGSHRERCTLIETPGHTPQDISTLVTTEGGVVAFTHLWWMADGPADDPYSEDAAALHSNRERVLGLAFEIVPGHGPRFVPNAQTPR